MGPKQSRKQGGGVGGGWVKTIIILQTSPNDPFMLSTYLAMKIKIKNLTGSYKKT